MKKKTGFTLIELIIAIAIGMLVVGFGSVALNNFNEQQKVEMAKQELLSELRLARNYAVTDQLNGGNRTVVEIDSNGLMTVNSYDKNDGIVKSFLSKDLTPEGVVITSPTISFSVTEGRSINGAVGITIKGDIGDSNSKNIKIDESGLIYEQ